MILIVPSEPANVTGILLAALFLAAMHTPMFEGEPVLDLRNVNQALKL